MKLPSVPRPALPSPGDWNCPYSKGGRVEMGRKAFKDSIYLQLPEHCVKTKQRCQSLKIVCLLLTCLPNVHSLFPIFMHTSPYSHEHNNIHFCQWQKWEMLQKRGFYLIQGCYWIWFSVPICNAISFIFWIISKNLYTTPGHMVFLIQYYCLIRKTCFYVYLIECLGISCCVFTALWKTDL